MIELKNIGLKYSSWILKDLNLSIHKGETVGLIGRSGSGKTSLLKLIACQIEPTEGGVYFNKMKLVGPVHKLIPGYNDIQLIDQDFGLEPYHTVEENIKEKILNLHLEDRNEMVQELLGLLELNHVKNQKAKNLSGGEQQRVAIARALACEPEVLLLDEPFVHLDQNIKIKIITYLKKLAKIRQMTLILASHDGSELMGFVDRVIHIEKGVVKREAVIEEMFYSPENKEQGVLMGIINEVEFKGEKILFRPNEYLISKSSGSIGLKYKSSINTGIVYLNTFITDTQEEVILSSIEKINHDINVEILKHR
jgi:ABC-type multidrug transport system ATPase subunit